MIKGNPIHLLPSKVILPYSIPHEGSVAFISNCLCDCKLNYNDNDNDNGNENILFDHNIQIYLIDRQ